MTNHIRDTLHFALKITEESKVPILALSAPGLGKTTIIKSWCEANGYKLTSLIGSQRTSEEILGYMVNNGDRLITFTPDWYNDIIANSKNSHKTLLFIDELSTAPENVQGSMLQLIFDRKVGGNNYLPEDTMVVAAANYKNNLPPQNSIMGPTLNRFCIINLQPEDGIGMINEFLQSPEDMKSDMIKFGSISITPKVETDLRENLSSILERLVAVYSKEKNNIDVENQNYNDLYERDGWVYNFMSGRTISYLYRCCLAIIKLDLCKKKYQTYIDLIIHGLIGAGTNSFKEKSEQDDWLISSSQAVRKALQLTVEHNLASSLSTVIKYTDDISENINKWTMYSETGPTTVCDDNLTRLVETIAKKYDPSVAGMESVILSLKDKKKTQAFLNDFLKIRSVLTAIKQIPLKQTEPMIATLETINQAYNGYVSQILSDISRGGK